MQVTVGWGYAGLVPNLELQDEIGRWYAATARQCGLGMYDLDGQEFLFHSGFGTYSVKRFFRSVFERAREYRLRDLRFTGGDDLRGSWHYQSVWNVGGGLNIYDVDKRVWGSTTSQGKDLRDVTYANFFPSSFGSTSPSARTQRPSSTEHIEATASGLRATYFLRINQNTTWRSARRSMSSSGHQDVGSVRVAPMPSPHIKRLLQDASLSWRLEEGADGNGWTLIRWRMAAKCARMSCTANFNVMS